MIWTPARARIESEDKDMRTILIAVIVLVVIGLCAWAGWAALQNAPCIGADCDTTPTSEVIVKTVIVTVEVPCDECGSEPPDDGEITPRPCFLAAEGTVKVTLDNGKTVEVSIVSPPVGTDGGPASIAPMTAAVVLPGCYIAADAQTSPWPFSKWTVRYDKGGSELGHVLLPNAAPVLVFVEWGGGVNYIEKATDSCGTETCDNGVQVISVP